MKIIFAPQVIRCRVQELVDAGWHPSDHDIREHAIWTLGVDAALDKGVWPCEVDVSVTGRSATLGA